MLSVTTDAIEKLLERGLACLRAGDLGGAEGCYGQVAAMVPGHPLALRFLSDIATGRGDFALAIRLVEQVLAANPGDAAALNSLGNALHRSGRLGEAEAAYQRGISLRPDIPELQNNLGNVLKFLEKYDEAIEAYLRAIELRPGYAEAHANFGGVLHLLGRVEEGIAALRRALELNPRMEAVRSKMLLDTHYCPGVGMGEIQREHEIWNQMHAAELGRTVAAHGNERSADRVLRIGYVSPDFREHVVGRNILPLFERRDRERFHVTCYSNGAADGMTKRFRGLADDWRVIAGVPDARVAEQVREDRIDVLVDLALHTRGGRALVFAQKPAPVQVTFAGYPGGTGLTTMDYRFSDSHLDPVGMFDGYFSEKTWRIGESFWCYVPAEKGLEVGPLPALANGFVTFGCLNNTCKLNDECLRMFAAVLGKVEGSRLILLVPVGRRQDAMRRIFETEGVNGSRIEFVGKASQKEYLSRFNRIDIGLDTVPYNGHTSSLDALWMGVPVVTLVGETVVGRGGLSQLSNLGLTELIARTVEEYVGIAERMAGNLAGLGKLRGTLRGRMEASCLMDAQRFAGNVERAYRAVWKRWCEGSEG